MNLDELTLSSRKVLTLLFVLACVVVAMALLRPRPGASPETADPAASTVPRELVGAPAVDSQPLVGDESVAHADDAGPWSEQDLAAAKRVAVAFAAAHASYRYDEPTDAAVARLRPFVTPEFAAELANNSGALGGRAALAALRQVATGEVQTVTADAVHEGSMTLLAIVRQEVVSVEGREARWPAYLLELVRSEAGWRVAGLQL